MTCRKPSWETGSCRVWCAQKQKQLSLTGGNCSACLSVLCLGMSNIDMLLPSLRGPKISFSTPPSGSSQLIITLTTDSCSVRSRWPPLSETCNNQWHWYDVAGKLPSISSFAAVTHLTRSSDWLDAPGASNQNWSRKEWLCSPGNNTPCHLIMSRTSLLNDMFDLCLIVFTEPELVCCLFLSICFTC